jgi:hypothetical protein
MATAKERHEKIPKAVKYGTVATAIMMGAIAVLCSKRHHKHI